jgi:distribution and morphology protein 10
MWHGELEEEKSALSKGENNQPQQQQRSNSARRKPILLYGRILETLNLEALFCKPLSSQSMILISGLSSLKKPSYSYCLAQWFWGSSAWTSVVSMHSTDKVVGFNTIYHPWLTPPGGLNSTSKSHYQSPFSFGTELYVSMMEKSGGLSLGAQYKETFSLISSSNCETESFSIMEKKNKDSKNNYGSITWTGIMNPMMGHFQSTFTSTVSRGCVASTLYSFNMYSLESDLGFGLAYSSLVNPGQTIRLRWSGQKGFGLGFDALAGLGKIGVGLELKWISMKPVSQFGLSFEI